MKVSTNLLRTGAALSTVALLNAQDAPSGVSNSHGDPFIPIGELSVTPTVVQPGVHPEMFWKIEYPQLIPDLVVIDNAGGMTMLNDKSDQLTMRVAGMAEGAGQVALWVRINNGGWDLIFYGTETDVDAGTAVFSTTIQSGTRIDLAARGTQSEGGWRNVQWTLNQSGSLEAMIDGAPLPAAISNKGPEAFMTQYVGPNNEVVAGPRDVIHVFELESGDPASPNFDLQDIVVVSTFGKNNNGHGNNIDGVDSSNPGQGDGGPNGAPDESADNPDGVGEGYVDDEGSKIKKK